MDAKIILVCLVFIATTNAGETRQQLYIKGGRGKPVRSIGQAMTYLMRFGYVSRHMGARMQLMEPDAIMRVARRPVRKFQRMANLPVTGRLDSATMERMSAPRCGVQDNTHEKNRYRRYALTARKWRKRHLTYRIKEYTARLSKGHVDQQISKALKFWSDVTTLTFSQKEQGSVDIEIRFVRGDHGDGTPFDKQYGTLAHAFFPEYNVGIDGDAHFDEAEQWTIGKKEGTNLLYVAIHEFGHSLGLLHSKVAGSIMWPWVRPYDPNIKLTEDDIGGIQKLYGKPQIIATTTNMATTTTTTTEVPSTNQPSSCSGIMDAVTVAADGHTYAFRGKLVYRLKEDTPGVVEGYPQPLYYIFPGAPDYIDAAITYTFGIKKTYLFKGKLYWRYTVNNEGTMNLNAGYPQQIKSGWLMDLHKIKASFVLKHEGTERLYFLQDDKYLRHTGYYVDQHGYTKDHSVLKHLPQDISAGMRWNNNKTFFYSGDKYYFWLESITGSRMVGPRDATLSWFGCTRKI